MTHARRTCEDITSSCGLSQVLMGIFQYFPSLLECFGFRGKNGNMKIRRITDSLCFCYLRISLWYIYRGRGVCVCYVAESRQTKHWLWSGPLVFLVPGRWTDSDRETWHITRFVHHILPINSYVHLQVCAFASNPLCCFCSPLLMFSAGMSIYQA